MDQLDKVTAVTYDAGGNQLTVRDPNNVGADMVYDALGRNTQRTDTFGDITKTDYDRSGNAVKQTDAKNKFTLISFDSRNRRKSTTDRITASTNFVYTALGQLLSLTDAENQTTAYAYDARGSKLTEQYPDHVANSTVGLTRDPIGYRGPSWSVYQFGGGHALNLVDPSGKVSISRIEDTLSHPESDCGNSGKEFGIVYQFEVENNCLSGKGWIVQEVTVKCAVDKCKNSRNCPRTLPPNSVHFFEAWRVTSGNTADGHPQFTDVATSYANDKTCGILRADGEVRFICDEDIPNVESPEHWQKDLDIFKRDPGPNCPVITSGGLSTSHDTPNLWGKSREASGKRFFQITWSKCCMCNIQQLGGPKQGSR